MEEHNYSVVLAALVWLQIVPATAVAQEVKSLHSLFTEKTAFVDSTLFGTWYDRGDTLTFRRAGDNFYHLIYASAGESSSFEAILDSFLFYRQKQKPLSISEKAPVSHPISSHAGFRLASPPDITASHPECQPRFPYVDGWLGGDGDLSIPLSKTQTLWIFSDTFVGKKDQTSREGAGMVANTIAISSCDDQYGWKIEYFWRNQYTDNPGPFFESHTDRYKFWPNEVFAHGDTFMLPCTKSARATAQLRTRFSIFRF